MKEKDPHNKDPHEKGSKLDAGKNRLALVLGGFAEALQEVGEIGTKGAIAYTPEGWKHVPDGIARYSDAALRHWFKHFCGAKFDKKSKQRHLAHLAWNVLALLTLTIKEETAKKHKPVEKLPRKKAPRYILKYANSSFSACERCVFSKDANGCRRHSAGCGPKGYYVKA